MVQSVISNGTGLHLVISNGIKVYIWQYSVTTSGSVTPNGNVFQLVVQSVTFNGTLLYLMVQRVISNGTLLHIVVHSFTFVGTRECWNTYGYWFL